MDYIIMKNFINATRKLRFYLLEKYQDFKQRNGILRFVFFIAQNDWARGWEKTESMR